MLDYFPFHNSEDAPERAVALMDLRFLLSCKKLDAWGMEALIDTLTTLVPELRGDREMNTKTQIKEEAKDT